MGALPSPLREGLGWAYPPPRKKKFSLEMACFDVLSAVIFVCAFIRKMLNFLLEVMVWSLSVEVEDVLILEIVKHDIIWGDSLH